MQFAITLQGLKTETFPMTNFSRKLSMNSKSLQVKQSFYAWITSRNPNIRKHQPSQHQSGDLFAFQFSTQLKSFNICSRLARDQLETRGNDSKQLSSVFLLILSRSRLVAFFKMHRIISIRQQLLLLHKKLVLVVLRLLPVNVKLAHFHSEYKVSSTQSRNSHSSKTTTKSRTNPFQSVLKQIRIQTNKKQVLQHMLGRRRSLITIDESPDCGLSRFDFFSP